jgi:hypothetical protein
MHSEISAAAVEHAGSVEAVAAMVGVPAITVKNWIGGVRKPTDAQFLQLIDIIYFWDFLGPEHRRAILHEMGRDLSFPPSLFRRNR